MTMKKDELLFLALGGSAEIGMNVNLYGTQGKWVMVDLGMTFADPYYPGVELILPDLQFIEQRRDDLLGIVLTHGHEDHIGALPYLVEDLGVPLYATGFTATLIARKLEEAGLRDAVKLNIIAENKDFALGPFGFRYLPLAHSIIEGNALLIDTPQGRIFHTGDWKLDNDPLIGSPTTPAELTAIGDAGVLALVCDSTNVFNPGASGSEGDVQRALIDVIKPLKGRVVVTTFASNAARLQSLGEVAKQSGRELCVAGRSLDRIIAAAKEHGYLPDFPPVRDFDEAMALPRDKVLIVATGGQGEARAALARIASASHPIKLDAGDTVIFSSKQIPGNELAIGRIQNQLAERNIDIITERQADIHVSGHPGKPELAAMYQWLRPEILIPVHGEMRHMREQARFGREQGIAQAVVQQNGQVVRLAPGPAQIIGHERTGRLILDGNVILPADGATMNERRKLSHNGTIAVALALGPTGKLVGEPSVRISGVPLEEDADEFLDEAVALVRERIGRAKPGSDKLLEDLRVAVRRLASEWTGKKPVVLVQILEL